MPAVIAHRGASAIRRENTLEAFKSAADLGADGVELDVRRTVDGRLAVHHDPLLEDGRTISELSADELPDFVPTLAAALDACAGMFVNIEIKNSPGDPDFDPDDTAAHAVVDLVRSRGMVADVLVSCFHFPTLETVHRLEPDLRTGYLVGATVMDDIALAAGQGHRAYHPWHGWLSPTWVDAAHEAGLAVYPWTVDDPERMAELVAYGVDGIITNVPDVARKVVDGT